MITAKHPVQKLAVNANFLIFSLFACYADVKKTCVIGLGKTQGNCDCFMHGIWSLIRSLIKLTQQYSPSAQPVVWHRFAALCCQASMAMI